MSSLNYTIIDLKAMLKDGVPFMVTRFDEKSGVTPDDLDILVKKKDFAKAISLLKKRGYKSYSHDQALGGRVRGAQMNLLKKGRIKIDLHRDFTWRKARYVDLNSIWANSIKQKLSGVKVSMPRKETDIFLILINLIFEKEYIKRGDYNFIKKEVSSVFSSKIFNQQVEKYGWGKTWQKFIKWFESVDFDEQTFPVFLPVSLVLFSYYEKLIQDKKIDFVSFLYYLFFRARYLTTKTLPYD